MANVNRKVSVVWDHFVDIGGHYATCNICKAKLSFRASVTNLKKHIDRKHPTVRVLERIGSASASGQLVLPSQSQAEPSTESFPQSSSAPSLSSLTAPPSHVFTQPQLHPPPRRTYGHQPITNFVPRRSNIVKAEIDKKNMNLFIKDFQPFRMVEDLGFRELMEYAFSNYVIPTRKYFANTMLPAVYEKVKADLKETVCTQVKSLCIIVDIWTSCANDSVLAVTGHYIEEEEFALKSFLLDCIPLLYTHTAKNLADSIKLICQEWNVAHKILLAVSDNGANIKSAIERELGWKHFPCYTHTLNLSVNDVLKDQDIAELLNKIKGIVRHFKQSNVAWEKLKRYQEQAGTTAKRPLQEVQTRWNSTYYMLQRCVELREPLNSAMVNLGMSPISSYEWQICHELCQILHPCEEVTRELSGQKYITGSLVIPITVGLLKALEQLGDQNVFMPVVDGLRQDLIGNIKRRFLNLNHSKTFGNCMFLDPRFKFYFEDQHVAEETKRRIVSLVAAQNSRDAATQSDVHVQAVDPTTSSSANQTKSIWQDFERRMQGIQPEGTAQSRAIIEVQRYQDDKIISRTDCPLKWWREHKSVCPTLYKIAATKLNAMASSVPCERVFSAAGNILNERRTRLGVRKLQQLIFLNQNM